ncbi:pre-mRNA-splicing factor rse1 [Neonectria magnoliae]|uniref:Pre-mRNA-splicing factor rse1 n=1 Tax=Neonectria magnoliae TaxID=2732573 RepID=A0ABR1HZV7_9HYPO
MFLYSLSIHPPTAIMQTITGQFSDAKEQHILTASGSLLALLRAHPTVGRVETLVSYDVFSIIRSVASFRPAGSARDYIIEATDSGRIAILEYLATGNRFSRVLLESFGRSGVRRLVPGHEDPSPVGRDHLMHRSYYVPVNLCERYRLLSTDKKQQISGELDQSVREIEREISDMRTRSAF